jgi:HTH-type transcriptional regulator/antitoxin HigA
MKPKVIKSKTEHEAVLARIEQLMDAAPGSSQEAELELWSLLAEKYEEEHFPIETPDPVAAIRFRMEQEGLLPGDLRRYLRSKSKVSEVLNHKRPLSMAMIRSLHYGLKIPAEILIQESPGTYSSSKPAKATKSPR